MIRELSCQAMVGRIGLGDDQQTAGILVDTMDDSGALLAPDTRQVATEMVQQCVHKCPRGRTRRRMHDHAHGFVDHKQVGIFVENGERYIFGRRLDVQGILYGDLEDIPLGNFHLRIHDSAAAVRDSAVRQKA